MTQHHAVDDWFSSAPWYGSTPDRFYRVVCLRGEWLRDYAFGSAVPLGETR